MDKSKWLQEHSPHIDVAQVNPIIITEVRMKQDADVPNTTKREAMQNHTTLLTGTATLSQVARGHSLPKRSGIDYVMYPGVRC